MRGARLGAGTPGLIIVRFIFALRGRCQARLPIMWRRVPMPPPRRPLSAELLARLTRDGELYEKLPDGRVRCFACGHRCLIPPGRDGVCRVRFNEGGMLRVPRGYVGGAAGRSDREEAVLPRAARRAARSRSACSAATITAATARTGSPRRRCATRRRWRRRRTIDARRSSSRLAQSSTARRSSPRPTTSR